MNVIQIDSKIGLDSPGEKAWLKVVVVYEDFATGIRAKNAFDRLLSRMGEMSDFDMNLWRFDLLGDQKLSAVAANEAAGADLIMLSAHGGADLPVSIKIWLGRWLSKRDNKASALVVSLDRNQFNSPDENQLLNFLNALTSRANVDLIPHYV